MNIISYYFSLCVIVYLSGTSISKKENSKTTRRESAAVIGVHFGRDYIRYSICDNDNVYIIPNRYGKYKTPIVINFNKYGNMFIGNAAKFNPNPYNTLYNLQKIIGKRFNQIRKMPHFPFKYDIIDKFNKPYLTIKFENGTFEMTVEEAVSSFFREIKENSEFYLNSKIYKIVLSVPDSFEEDQELALKAAANKGGLTVIKTIKDSNAAIYGYKINEIQEEKIILTINAGRELTDFVVNTVENNNIELVGKALDSNIGDIDFDKELEKYLMIQYDRRHGAFYQRPYIMEELRRQVKYARLYLSVFYEADFYWNNVNNEIDDVDRIDRAKFDDVLYEPISKLLNTVTNLLVDLEIKRFDISYVILVGSIFWIPKIQNEIRNYFYGIELRTEKDLDEVVVEGASIVGFNTQDSSARSNVVHLNTKSFNMGIEVFNGVFQVIVPRGSLIPLKVSQNFTFTFDYQEKVSIKILEGERSSTRGNTFLGELIFDYVSKGVRDFVLFNIEFDVHNDKEVIVTATDIGLGIKKSLLIKADYEKNTEQRMHHDMMDERTQKNDYTFKMMNDIRKEMEPVAYEIKAYITTNNTLLERIKSPIDYQMLQQSVEEVILWLESRSSSEVSEIESIKEKFESTIKPILARAYGE